MNYWLTTHWPPIKSQQRGYWVHLQEGLQQVGNDIKIGDLIFVYETETGPELKGKNRRIVGKQVIFALVEVISRLERSGEKPKVYTNSKTRHWAWQIRTRLVKKCNIPIEKVRRVLDYKPKFYLRYRSGLKKISKNQFKKLEALCK